jgi:glycosyltransferase involved in cell wall biosynthesis
LDAFVCIRNGDMETLQAQFGVSSERCFFAPYPAPSSLPVSVERPEEEEPYLYSAGSAHRDWETLIAALRMLPYRAVISPGSPFRCTSDLPSHIRVLPPQPPESGRLWMAHAQAAVFSFEDTRLPSGPLVLLDAMVMAKPIVATRVNGTRDYLVHGETGLLVAPRDPVAMASAIRRVMEENGLARRLGVAAREVARTRFTAADFVGALIEACEGPCREEGRREPFLSARG